MDSYIISDKNKALYFELFQNARFYNYMNPVLRKENFPHFSPPRNKKYFLVGYHEGDTIVSIGHCAYYPLEKKWGLSYINVHPLYKNQGYGKRTFELLESLAPKKLSIGGFTPEGFLYMRPFLERKKYKVRNIVDFYPPNWDDKKIKQFKNKNGL